MIFLKFLTVPNNGGLVWKKNVLESMWTHQVEIQLNYAVLTNYEMEWGTE